VPNRLRPDLYVKVDDEHDYVFEVKQSGIDFNDRGSVIERKLVENLRRARNKTYDYKGEALYRCSLVIAPIWMDINDWTKYGVSSSYHQGVAKLREHLRSAFNSLPLGLANFCGGFVCSCQEASEEHDRAREEKRSPFPVGAAYMGRMKPPGRPGR